MRVGFAGTPDFAACALAAIRTSGYTIPLVLTQPDRPSGRGLALAASPVKRLALNERLPVRQPASLKRLDEQQALRAIDLDVLVVAAYGLILPQAVLDWPRHGCLNIHASLLPRWRGAAPIARAIEAGDPQSGVTIMRMEAGLDTGPIVIREAVNVAPRETTGTLHDKLADVGARLIVDALRALARDGALPATPQSAAGVTYARKVESADTIIDWAAPALVLDRKVRALAPAPGATASWNGSAFKIRTALALDRAASCPPGVIASVSKAGIDVACGDGTLLRLADVQPAGGKPMPAQAFAVGRALAPGSRFDLG
jgi:methionyl-tRNA formyltransferase